MSKFRPALRRGSVYPCMTNGTAYLMIYHAVQLQLGLIHGQLEADDQYCAIGSYFHVNNKTALPEQLIDEVAAVNDSMPQKSPVQRKRMMLRWLRWKLTALGMPGYGVKQRPRQERQP